MAGYSGTPLAKKLGIKPGARVLLDGAPAGFEAQLVGLPEDARVTRSTRGACFDVLVCFVASQAALAKRFKALRPKLDDAGGLWFAWPKKSSGMKNDLTEDDVRALALSAGLVDNKVCAIDETWSGLRIVVRVKDRKKR